MGKIQSFASGSKTQLVIIHLKVAFFNLLQFVRESFLYYRNLKFAKIDLMLKSKYLFKSPYKISKQFLKERGQKELYTYGETPLTTWDLIAKKCGILSHDVVYDLGSGTGRGCFWLSSFTRCKTVGIDFVPTFINKAKAIKMENVTFLEKDFHEVILEEATFVYIAATAFDEVQLESIRKNLKKGTKVITVSQKLKGLKEIGEFEAKFPWGKSKVFFGMY